MVLFKKINDLQDYLRLQRASGKTIGFVPTMGALHAGHLSLIAAAKDGNDMSACSIFVNPTQFNDPADFEKYPSSIENDLALLEESGCNVVFLPSVHEMYPAGPTVTKHYELGTLETRLEGQYRPGHFQGVCAVVDRLLRIVEPDNLYMGQKDYQQCMVIRRLIELMEGKITLHISPTLREASGLAMSSRNMRLSNDEKETAAVISQSLLYIKNNLAAIPIDQLQEHAVTMLAEKGFRIDYVAIVDATDLSPIGDRDRKQPAVALVAAFLGDVRLIDNMILNQPY